MRTRFSQRGCAAIATGVALGLYQVCFSNNATSFIAPSPRGRAGIQQGEAKSLPLGLVLASAQPAVAVTDVNTYDGTVACIAAFTAVFATIFFFKRAHVACNPPVVASVPIAQQRRQLIVPFGVVVAAPPSMCVANEEDANLTPAEKAKKAREEKEAAAKKKREEEKEKAEEKKKEQEAKKKKEKDEKEAKIKREKEEKEAKTKKEKEEKEKASKEAKEKKEKEEKEKAEAAKKKEEEEKKRKEEEAKKQAGGDSIFDTLGKIVVGGLGVAAVLPKKEKAGAKKEDGAPKGEPAATKAEEPKAEAPKKDEA